MNSKRFISFSTILLTTVSSVFSQCIVGGTEFNTEPELCNPTMVSDDNEENGWFSAKVAEIIAKQCSNSNFFEHPSNVIQKGLPSNKLSVVGNASLTWKELLNARTPSDKDTGLVVVTSNPKLISPYLSEGNGSAMLVAMGNGHGFPFFTYTVEGLVPNSTVTMTADVYDLLDINELGTALKAMNSGVTSAKDYIREIPLPYGGSYIVPLNAGVMDYKQGRINGIIDNQFSITGATTTNNGMAPTGMGVASVTPTNGGKQLKISAKADNTGVVSFYLWRNPGGNARPIGLDNITIEGEIMPVIKAGETLCPMNPYTMRLSSTYPAGTTYSWKVAEDGSQTSDMATFSFIPKIASKYNVTCDVTLPGCMSAKSKTFTFETSKNCCESADGAPMAITNLFFDDFGNFISDDLYEWTDKYGVTHTEQIPSGQVHTSMSHGGDLKIPYVKAYNIESSGATFVVPLVGTDPKKTELYNQGVYVVSKYGGYPGGVLYDNSGTQTGGMLQFDLLDDGSQDEFFEIDIDHICAGKEVSFGLDFASISVHPGAIEVKLEHDGKAITSKTASVSGGSDGWRNISGTFAINAADVEGASEVTITMKISNTLTTTTGEGRDYALDNIFFAVCTPPNIELNYSVNTGKNLLNLCTNDVLTLNAVTSDAMSKFYTYYNGQLDPSKKIGYVYQYTFQDPSTETEINRIKWHTIHKEEVVETKSFDVEFEKYWDEISSNMTDNANLIYFRVVAGEYSDLIADQSWKKHSALSPCRKVSISNIPIVASLNCPACVAPDEVVITMKGNGKYDSIKSILYLCPGDSAQFEVGEIIGTDADNKSYYNYVASWHKDDINSTPLMKKACSDADHGAHTFTISYDDVIADGKDEAKYIILIHDNNDPSLSSTPCDHADTIRVVANSRPDQTLWYNNPSICQGTDYKIEHIPGFKINWYKDKDALERIEEPVIGDLKIDDPMGTGLLSYYYTLTDNNTGCQGDVHEFTVEISNVTNTVDNTNKIEYYKKDVKDGQLKSLEEQNKTVFKSALSMTDYILRIGLVENATEATVPDLKSAKLGDASSIIPTPTVKDVNSTDDEYLWYYTYLESVDGCVSDTVLVGVIINGEETSLKNALAKAVSIAPNPASTKISVIAEEAVEKVEILNMVGEVVKVSNRKDIDTSNLSNGVYFVRTTINDETTVHKLVINK